MRFILSLITWYHAETLGTRLYTWLRGKKVGEDAFGNRYYRNADDTKRWVIYAGEPVGSKVPPEWHGWLHRIFEKPPTQEPLPHKPWEKPHRDNPTGTPDAYVPAGSIRRPRPVERTDYEAWQP